MFNHESPLRPDGFVAHRIVRGAIEIAQKKAERLRLGNLDIVRDWGWAPDFVEGMWMMLQQESPRDFVFATGIGTSLEVMVERVFNRFGFNWRDYVVCEEQLLRPSDIAISIGNPQRARDEMGWSARVRMPEIADRLVEAALSVTG
jgi:GDPmannose 4,6-dehydratase